MRIGGFRVDGFLGCWVMNPLPSKDSYFEGFWAQRPFCIRLLGSFDAEGKGRVMGSDIRIVVRRVRTKFRLYRGLNS